jgi:hypothetical protein
MPSYFELRHCYSKCAVCIYVLLNLDCAESGGAGASGALLAMGAGGVGLVLVTAVAVVFCYCRRRAVAQRTHLHSQCSNHRIIIPAYAIEQQCSQAFQMKCNFFITYSFIMQILSILGTGFMFVHSAPVLVLN